MLKEILEFFTAQTDAEYVRTLLILSLLKKNSQENRLLTFRLTCPCGKKHYIVSLLSKPSVVETGTTPEEAKRKLLAKLQEKEIHDQPSEGF